MSQILWFLSEISLLVGGIFCLIGAIGLLRMPDFFTKLHAASLIETLSAFFIILGLVIETGLTLITVKLIFIVVFLLFTGPTATHAIARAAVVRGLDPRFKTEDKS